MRRRRWGAVLLAALAGLAHVPAADAVITTVADTGSTYAITLRVGSLSGVDTVNFNVAGTNVGLTPAAVAGTPAIDISVTPVRPISTSNTERPVTLRVNTSAGLTCQSGGCGTTVIPFSEISWVASNNSNATSGDIQSGRFDGSASQQLARFNANATFCSLGLIVCLSWTYQSRTMNATRLQFSYDNDVIYPAGNYRGTVVFTASME